jgi:hypothetical protein
LKGGDVAFSCYCYELKTQGECDAPHLLPFIVGFAIKNRHKQTTIMITSKNKRKRMKEKFTLLNEECYKKTKK